MASQKSFMLLFLVNLDLTMLKAFNLFFEKGELSTSQKQAVITLIQEKVEMPCRLKTGDQSL